MVVGLLLTTVANTSGAFQQEGEEVILGRPSGMRAITVPEKTTLIPAGARLRERPQNQAPVVETFDSAIELPVLDERDGWVQVRYGAWLGWVRVAGGEPHEPLQVPANPDLGRLKLALDLLGEEVEAGSLGPYTLYTDVADPRLLDRLSAVASGVDQAYRKRYGLDPGSLAGTVVVLFAEEQDYRRFEAAEHRIASANSHGYTSEGLSVLFTGPQQVDAIVRVLVHELTHLLGRRVFQVRIPPWLDEGMAQDLAFSRIDRSGILRPGTLSTVETRVDDLVRIWNGPNRTGLVELISLDWTDFVDPISRPHRYALSAFLIRYLLDGRDEQLRSGFLRYLSNLKSSELPESVSLFEMLDTEPGRVESGLYQFLASQARTHGLR